MIGPRSWAGPAPMQATADRPRPAVAGSVGSNAADGWRRGCVTGDFLTDVQTLRERAQERARIRVGPVIAGYGADLDRVLAVLNDALATEIVCVLRYKQHHLAAAGLDGGPVAAEFLAHAAEEQTHADAIAARIAQLGGVPDLDPDTLTGRAHAQHRTCCDLLELVAEDLVAERVAIESHAEIIAWLGDKDPTTRRMLETILANEEEHAQDMLTFLQKMSWVR
jgi:bacterioferritin